MVKDYRKRTYSHGYGGSEWDGGHETVYIPECPCYETPTFSIEISFSSFVKASEHEESCILIVCDLCGTETTPSKSHDISDRIFCDFCNMTLHRNNVLQDLLTDINDIYEDKIEEAKKEVWDLFKEKYKRNAVFFEVVAKMLEVRDERDGDARMI